MNERQIDPAALPGLVYTKIVTIDEARGFLGLPPLPSVSPSADVGQWPLGRLDISTRAINALESSGIDTVANLCNHSERQIKNLRHIGYVTSLEIRDALAKHGLALRAPV